MSFPRPEESCWLHPAATPGPSAIAGTGLFATDPLPAGTRVSRLGGRLVDGAELARLLDEQLNRATYVDTIVVDADTHLVLPDGVPNRYGNHSCEPNTGWEGCYDLVALRDIAAGEELTHDYATSTADPDFLLRCHCETYRCRQMIEGTDWRIPQLQRRYAGHWVPYLQRLIEAG